MKVDFVIFEDQKVRTADLMPGVTEARERYALDKRKITIHPKTPVQVTSTATLNRCIVQAKGVKGQGRIVCIDLDLLQNGLSLGAAVKCHDAAVVASLRLRGTADQGKSGGFLLAWHVLDSKHPRQLLVFATGQMAEDPIRERVELMLTELHSAVAFRILRGTLAHQAQRSNYIKQAVEWWLQLFWVPKARIHPEGSLVSVKNGVCASSRKGWFEDDSAACIVKHTWCDSLARCKLYTGKVVGYLADVLQLSEGDVKRGYSLLHINIKAQLHDYLKALVGNSAACHAGKGYRLQWRHMPFLAGACAPAPGRWIFSEKDFPWQLSTDILPANTAKDSTLLELLVGDADGTRKGVLPQILTKKGDENTSALVGCKAAKGSCMITVNYCTKKLAENFQKCVRKNGKLGHDSSDALFELHVFLQGHGAAVRVNGDNSIVIERPSNRRHA